MTNPILPDSQKISVLYVDDEQDNLIGFKYMFRKDYDLSLAQSADEALEILDAKKFDIIISDQRMPGKSGVELFEQIHKTHPDTMRMILTGYSDLDAVVDSINKGRIYYFFKKPWDETEVRLVIAHAYDALTLRRQLTMREQRFCDIANSVGGWIWELDTEGRYTFASERVQNILGYRPDELIGKKPEDFVLPEKQHSFHVTFSSLINKQQRISDLTHWCLSKTGEKILVSSEGLPIFNNGKPSGTRGVDMDITAKHNLEQQLRQSQKMEAVGNLAGGIAHDFNNILSSIIGFTELALDDAENGTELEDDLLEVHKAGMRAKDLVKQILNFARQSDETVISIQVSIIVKEVLKFIKSSIPATIQINDKIISDSFIMGSPTQLHQVLMNLCTNAAQAMEEKGGVLDVSVRETTIDRMDIPDLQSGEYVVITVTDTGMGISPQHIHNIFDPYFTTKPVGAGSGLGLAVVHGIVESYGGKITADSTVGQGSSFIIYLPVIKNRKVRTYSEKEGLRLGNENILFVDDEAPIAKMGGKILEQLGYSVTIRTSSIEALELFRSKPKTFDLVVTDMTMPNMTGDKLAIELIKIRSDIPVVLCTGYSKRISEESAADIGIKAFLYKPIIKSDFAKTVRRVLDEINPE